MWFISIKAEILTFSNNPANIVFYLQACYSTNSTYRAIKNSKIWGTAHHMPLKLFFTLHEIEAKLTKVQLQTVVVFWWKGRKVPCLNLISSKFYSRYIFHFCEFFMFSQARSIKLFMALNNREGNIQII